MLTALSASSRLARAFTGLVTAWCLGCSGFEPLLAALSMRNSSGMECERAMAAGGHERAVSATAPARDMDCGCAQSCVAAAPTDATPASSVEPAPIARSLDVTAPPSIDRRPLLPPPERIVA